MKNPILIAYRRVMPVLIKAGFGRLPFVRAVHRLVHDKIITRFREKSVTIDGHLIYLDELDALDLSINGIHEPAETELVKKEIKEGAVVIDIGANIGYFSLIFAKLAGPSGKIYAFEPESENFAILQKNIQANGYSNVVMINKAVADRNQVLKFYLSKSDGAKHSLINSDDSGKYVEIPAVSLDEYFSGDSLKADFIKIDIEGAEIKALDGMRKFINSQGNLKMLIEFAPRMMEGGDEEGAQIYKILKEDFGFEIFNLNRQSGLCESTSLEYLLKNYGTSTSRHTNLFCKR